MTSSLEDSFVSLETSLSKLKTSNSELALYYAAIPNLSLLGVIGLSKLAQGLLDMGYSAPFMLKLMPVWALTVDIPSVLRCMSTENLETELWLSLNHAQLVKGI